MVMNPFREPSMDVLFLPATEPGDINYGNPPGRLEAFPGLVLRELIWPGLVWYNEAVRHEAARRIRALGTASLILVGFSKSGLGAWNIARAMPDLVRATLIFDAPVARPSLPPWGTAPFYSSDAEWQADLPLNSVESFRDTMPAGHRLVLVSGANFHDEMERLSLSSFRAGLEHLFLPRPDMSHHWCSGWIEEGLSAILNVPEG